MRVLFAAQDPGSANALAPVIKKLSAKASVKVLGAKYAVPMFAREKIRATDCTSYSDAQLADVVVAWKPDIMVLGASAGLSIEKRFTLIARARGIRTVSVIDYWSGYDDRFGEKINKRHRYLPDDICVIDRVMKRELLELGVPAGAIAITGNPALEASIKKIRTKTKHPKNLLYISTPFSSLHPNPYPFNEFQVLEDVLGYAQWKDYGPVIVKLHPKEEEGKYDELIARYPEVPVRVVKDADLYRLLSEATLIVGTNSIVLLEASIAGKPVISYQPGLHPKDDVLVSNRRGLSRAIYHKKDLYDYLDEYYRRKQWSPPARTLSVLKKQYANMNATQNIITFITKIWKKIKRK
ncbi:MAG: hypothetical protein Q7R85_01835 [bacterium]|nr:hypothetical protein [bacterium]